MLREKITSLIQSFTKSEASYRKRIAISTDVLTQSVRLTRDLESINVSQVLKIVRQPFYDIMSPYFALKILDSRPQEQIGVLRDIVNSPDLREEATKALQRIHDTWPDEGTLRVKPKKTSSVNAIGPRTWAERERQIIERVRHNSDSPVIAAYSGVLALEAVVPTMKPADEVFIVIPNRVEQTDEAQIGYKLTKTTEQIVVDFLNRDETQTTEPLGVIDDLQNSGKTLRLVSSAFPNAPKTNYLLYEQSAKLQDKTKTLATTR